MTDAWATDWHHEALLRQATIDALGATNAALTARAEAAEAERDTWRQRAEEAEEVVGTLQLYNERLREALDILIDIINSAMQASESRAHKANDIYEEAVFARMPPFADTANTVADERTNDD